GCAGQDFGGFASFEGGGGDGERGGSDRAHRRGAGGGEDGFVSVIGFVDGDGGSGSEIGRGQWVDCGAAWGRFESGGEEIGGGASAQSENDSGDRAGGKTD